jgi:Glyoxalase/Bleomycin resistance protein/Dioxygenase superfamily
MTLLSRFPVFQQAWFVADLDDAIQEWSRAFGAGPFVRAWHHKCDTFTYRGSDQEPDVSYAFGYLGNTMIQFIQQDDETPSIYRDMYGPGQQGYHHMAILASDFEGEYQRLVALGIESVCRLYADGVDAAYFDTRDLNGGFTEIHGDPPHILEKFATWRRAHELYRPGDSPFLARAARP